MEVLGAVAAALELVKVARSCLSLFNDIRHVDVQETERLELKFHLVVQGIKFEGWCTSLGIQEMFDLANTDSRAWAISPRVETFVAELQSQLHFKNPEFARLTLSILDRIIRKFSAADSIMTKYSAIPPQISASVPAKVSRLGSKWPRFTWKTINDPKSSLHCNDSSDDMNVSKLMLARVQWAAHDKGTALELLESIRSLNNSLVDLLHPRLQAQVDRRTNMAVLENLGSGNHAVLQSLPEKSDLRALASMKRWQVQEAKDDLEDASPVKSYFSSGSDVKIQKPPIFPVQDFKHNSLGSGDSRSLSILEGNPVVVEWKYYGNKHPFKIEHSFRLTHLLRLLNQNDLFRKFQALSCKGLVDDRDNSRIGMVFATGENGSITTMSLQEVISYSSRAPPPIGERFLLAKNISIATHNLHSVKWLHKGIRSDNIICFQKHNLDSEKPPLESSLAQNESKRDLTSGQKKGTSDLGSLRGPPEPLARFHLLGWNLSRPDHPTEFSESISIPTTGFRTRRDNIELYTHPDVSWSGQTPDTRQRFEAKFDIYSVGLILLEIGLWRTLGEIRRKSNTNEEFRSKVRTEYCDRLQPVMGLIYWRAVQRCLNDDFGSTAGLQGEGDYSRQVGFEKHVVCELEKCFA